MKKYKVTASQTIYATYEIEVEAANEQQAEKRALATSMNDILCLFFVFSFNSDFILL